MNYKITKKIKPKGLEPILFKKKDGNQMIINFNDMKLQKIHETNQNIMNDELIEIYFPIYDHYFSLTYRSKNGWNIKKIINAVYKTGLAAGKYLNQYQPHLLNNIPENYLHMHYITSNDKKSDLMKKNNSIYVNINLLSNNQEKYIDEKENSNNHMQISKDKLKNKITESILQTSDNVLKKQDTLLKKTKENNLKLIEEI